MADTAHSRIFFGQRAAAGLLLALASSFALASPAPVTVPVAEALPNGATGGSSAYTSVSEDGRYIAYVTTTRSPKGNIFVTDRMTGTSVQADLTAAGLPSAGSYTSSPVISADGRYVAFRTLATDMGISNNQSGYFIFDRITNITKPIYIGNALNTPLRSLAISADGRYVAYRAHIASGDIESNIYVYDRISGTSESVTTTHTVGNSFIQISDDGRYIGYVGQVRWPGIGPSNVLLHDRVTGVTEMIEVGSTQGMWMSADGSVLAFVTGTNMLPGDITGTQDVFVRDRKTGTTERVSSPVSKNSQSGVYGAHLSSDGRFVSFFGFVYPPNVTQGLYRYDRVTRTMKRALPAAGFDPYVFLHPDISGDGRYVLAEGSLLPSGSGRRILITDFGTPTGVSVTPAAVTLAEGGGNATYEAVLLQQPTADVTVNAVPDAQLSLARSHLTFTAANWNTPQTFSVQAPANNIAQGTHAGIIKHSATSADPEYTGVPVASVTATITEGVAPTIVVPTLWSPEPIPLRGTAAPGATVLITVSTDGAPAFISVSTVADAQGNWASALFIPGPGPYQLEAIADGIHSIVYEMNLAEDGSP